MLADSRPQGRQNWFMVEVFGIHAEALPRAAELFEELYALQFRDGVGADELEISRGWVEELRSAIFHHTLVPTGLGPRRATLAHKTHALLRSIRLESENWSQVQDFLSSVATITSDQGVEMGLNLASARLQDLFPYWLQPCIRLEEDTGVMDESALPNWPSPSVNEPAPAAAPDLDPEGISLRKSLFVPGMFHIVDGIRKDMLKECKAWVQVKPHFEHLLSFFHKSSCRIMFVQSCLALFPELRGGTRGSSIQVHRCLREVGPGVFCKRAFHGCLSESEPFANLGALIGSTILGG